MEAYDGLYIGGRWRPAADSARTEVVNPANEQVIATVAVAGPADVDAAVAAAREALPGWAATPPAERAARLTALRDALAARQDEIAATVTAELGTPVRYAAAIHVRTPVAVAGHYARIVTEYPFEERVGHSRVLYRPVGVVGAITPWNYPLHQIVAKVAPALAAGCTVVLKPAETTPLVARLFAEAVDAAGIPDGVVNVVVGLGPVAGRALAEHSGVDMLSFTGSTAVGRQVGALAGQQVKPVALELGGKSANVVLPGADLARAVRAGVNSVMTNAGQTCSAWTRMLVHRDHLEEALELATAAVARYAPGDPTDPGTWLGPVANAAQYRRVTGYVRRGLEEGARLVVGGPERPEGLDRGYYVRPTVLADVTPDMTVAREEIFGPVLCVLTYRDVEEALRIANDSDYGLAGAVWAADEEEAVAFASRMETGQVDINGAGFNPLAPFGGWKQSGVGRELGRHGLAEYLQTTSLQL